MKAQLENGFTRLANAIIDKLCVTKLNGTQFCILFFIWRHTYGFQRKSFAMSLNFIASGISTHRVQVKRELDKLIEWKIISVHQEAAFNKSRVIGFNKNLNDWILDGLESNKQSAIPFTVSETDEKQSTRKLTPTVNGLAHQRKKDLKDIKNIYIAQFDEFWSLYPSKKGKANALVNWLSLAPSMNFEKVMDSTRAYIEYCKATNRPYKDGFTFVNQASWEDDWSIVDRPNVDPVNQLGYSKGKRPTPRDESPYDYPPNFIAGGIYANT